MQEIIDFGPGVEGCDDCIRWKDGYLGCTMNCSPRGLPESSKAANDETAPPKRPTLRLRYGKGRA